MHRIHFVQTMRNTGMNTRRSLLWSSAMFSSVLHRYSADSAVTSFFASRVDWPWSICIWHADTNKFACEQQEHLGTVVIARPNLSLMTFRVHSCQSDVGNPKHRTLIVGTELHLQSRIVWWGYCLHLLPTRVIGARYGGCSHCYLW